MQNQTTSFDLLERARRGDDRAFEAIFQRYRSRLSVLIHYRMSDALRRDWDVDDVLQEVFLRAARDLAGFHYRGPTSLFRWLAQIAHHVLADAARSGARAKRDGGAAVRFRSESNPAGFEPVDTNTPSRVMRRQEAIGDWNAKLAALPEDYRDVIVMARMEGLTTAEIAERMGKTREQVSLLLHRALKKYRGML